MILFSLLQSAAAAGQAQGNSASFWIMIIAIFLVMWLFMIRPQRKQQKELEKFRSGLQKGDKVITAGGIYGTVVEVQENRSVLIKVDGEVKIRVDKTSIMRDSTDVQQNQPAQK